MEATTKRKIAIATIAFALGMMTRGYGIGNGAATSGVIINYWFSNEETTCHDLGLELIGNPGWFKDEC